MRPLKRNDNSNPYSDYKKYGNDLLSNFSPSSDYCYCAYCEVRLNDEWDVEHILPIKQYPHLKTEWQNLLLSCKTCNKQKNGYLLSSEWKFNHKDKTKEYVPTENKFLSRFYFPDRDNTFKVFEYQEGQIKPSSNLNSQETIRAEETIALYKLLHPKKPKRQNQRRETWDVANQYLDDYTKQKISVDYVVKHAIWTGFWSIWMTVFDGYDEVKDKLIEAFPGTYRDYCLPQSNTRCQQLPMQSKRSKRRNRHRSKKN